MEKRRRCIRREGTSILFESSFQVASANLFQYHRVEPISPGSTLATLCSGAVAHQNDVALQLQAVLASDPYGMHARLLLRRPYLIWWQMNQIHRAMILWSLDHSLTFAVDVALNMLPIARFLSAMWPCPEQRRRMKRLMGRLQQICLFTGQTIPAPSSFEAFMKKPIA